MRLLYAYYIEIDLAVDKHVRNTAIYGYYDYGGPSTCLICIFFCKGALFRGKGGPPVIEKRARHLPRQRRGVC